MRIDSSGNFLVGRTNTITIAGDPSNACFEQLTDNGMPLTVHCAQTNKRGLGLFIHLVAQHQILFVVRLTIQQNSLLQEMVTLKMLITVMVQYQMYHLKKIL